jgi:tRNA A-37 threonylcarbamoyl transferase component Bud32/TolB-like protein
MADPERELSEALAPDYLIQHRLGQGGMATVYQATDVRHEREVALKVLRRELAVVLGADRFRNEIRVTARLQHPNILPVLESGEAAGLLWYTMPLVSGGSLRDRLARERQLPLNEALAITREVADALAAAHQQGIIHRDIKPENILLAGGHALVADFGIARALDAAGSERLTETGLTLGTPHYMSPEQSAGETRLDGRSDLYALGSVLYEMLAGEPPYTGPTGQAIIAKRLSLPVPSVRTLRETVPEAVDQALATALARTPADRFATTAEFATALGAAATAPARTVPRARPTSLRGSLRLGLALLAIAAVGLFIARRQTAGTPTPTQVVVSPFRVSGADPALAYLGEGLVDLLTIRLSGEGEFRAVEPRRVLSTWQRESPGGGEVGPDAALRLTQGLGAGLLVDGAVVGTPARLTLTASVLNAQTGRVGGHATVEGPADSLSEMVDRLAVQLLGLQGGLEAQTLTHLTTRSPEAMRAYLAGRKAYRRGDVEEGARGFGRALDLDSTFVQPALSLALLNGWCCFDEALIERGEALAWAGRDRLPAADRAWLEASRVAWTSLHRWETMVAAYPDRPEMWYALGDVYYHVGALMGVDQPLRRAEEAFQRGWQVDSATSMGTTLLEQAPGVPEPLFHMVELAQLNGDTASIRRMVEANHAPAKSALARYLKWHLAVASGPAARDSFFARPGAAAELVDLIAPFTQWTGLAVSDAERAIRLDGRHGPDAAEMLALIGAGVARNGGRPVQASRLEGNDLSPEALRSRVRIGLFWEGDSTRTAEAVRLLEAMPLPPRGENWVQGYQNLCALAEWRAVRGDLGGIDRDIQTLRQPDFTRVSPRDTAGLRGLSTMCAAELEAIRAYQRRLPDSAARLETLDSLAQARFQETLDGTNLIVARLAEAQGDLPRALRAIRRRTGWFMLRYWGMSTYFREEGRIALLVGDTAGAISAYQRYLGLRPDPEPALRPEVERVRAELARLAGEHPAP